MQMLYTSTAQVTVTAINGGAQVVERRFSFGDRLLAWRQHEARRNVTDGWWKFRSFICRYKNRFTPQVHL
jgi:hypothetical protein